MPFLPFRRRNESGGGHGNPPYTINDGVSHMAIIENEFIELTEGLDLEAFWAENAQCRGFTTDKPRCMLSFSPDDHWIFEFMDCATTTTRHIATRCTKR
jgi:hypothetical protein